MKIDVTTEMISLVSDILSQYKDYKYDGGVFDQGCNIYAIASFANKVTKFKTTTQEISEIGIIEIINVRSGV